MHNRYLIKIYQKMPQMSFELRCTYSMLTKESFEIINHKSLTLNDSDFYYNNRLLFPSSSLIYDDNDNMKKVIMYYGKQYLNLKNRIDYFTWIYKLRDDFFSINLTKINEVAEILKTQTIRQLFKQILTSNLFLVFIKMNISENNAMSNILNYVNSLSQKKSWIPFLINTFM